MIPPPNGGHWTLLYIDFVRRCGIEIQQLSSSVCYPAKTNTLFTHLSSLVECSNLRLSGVFANLTLVARRVRNALNGFLLPSHFECFPSFETFYFATTNLKLCRSSHSLQREQRTCQSKLHFCPHLPLESPIYLLSSI